jgi:hypothetical protein
LVRISKTNSQVGFNYNGLRNRKRFIEDMHELCETASGLLKNMREPAALSILGSK